MHHDIHVSGISDEDMFLLKNRIKHIKEGDILELLSIRSLTGNIMDLPQVTIITSQGYWGENFAGNDILWLVLL